MIVIAVTVPINADKHDAVVEATVAMRNATLAEDGCFEYRFSFATDDPGMMLIFEEWRDAEALTAHFSAPHMAVFQGALGQLVTGALVGHRYEVSSKGPLR
ncbi:unannotated protein [freshwater metagenome]|uniref:Unannotated protein n=1 Tax=freshwater metagenome TaxID=449393 RepID=A0A6J7CUM6_9ZZZZ|nr:hypothetical protein [Actinomycetota bacterium]